MAEKRMFAKTIIDSDSFLDMPLSTQALYFHLSMRADDDGFINNPKKIQRVVGAADDDLKLLIFKNFVIPFESGVCVIKHWFIHNYIRGDRYKPTVYQEEREQLDVKENKAYTLGNPSVEALPDGMTVGIPSGNHMVDQPETQYRLDKSSIDLEENSILHGAETPPSRNIPPLNASLIVISITLNDKTEYPITEEDVKEWKELYPAVDVLQELRKMRGWAIANPTKRKTKNGIKRFINSWLAKEQDRRRATQNNGRESRQPEEWGEMPWDKE